MTVYLLQAARYGQGDWQNLPVPAYESEREARRRLVCIRPDDEWAWTPGLEFRIVRVDGDAEVLPEQDLAGKVIGKSLPGKYAFGMCDFLYFSSNGKWESEGISISPLTVLTESC